ncbi:MAG: vanadium-dependent haloperoxidase [Luteolibacter sp.]
MNVSDQSPETAIKTLPRRAFLAMGTAAFGLPSLASATPHGNGNAPRHPLFHPLTRTLLRRRADALHVRHSAAIQQARTPLPRLLVNGDEALPGFIGSFSKSMPHDALGVVDPAAYRALVKATETGRPADFAAIPRGGAAKLANPQAAFAFSLGGGDSHSFDMPAPPAFSSAWEAGEMVEVYLHAQLRDLAFEEYSSSPLATTASARLNALSDFRGPRDSGSVTPATLFRGETAGDLVGNYVSQFLLLPVPHGASTLHRVIRTTQQGDDHMTNVPAYLAAQNGTALLSSNQFDPTPRYIASARDLGEYVHRDYSYQAFLEAALILLGSGAPVNPGNPYPAIANQGAFITFGGPDILTLVAEAAQEGLKAAWFHKWRIHRRLRPEQFGIRVHNQKTGAATYPIHSDVLNSPVLADIFATYGTYLLPMAFAEGSPTHPAYPAGHAAIAGACVTVLKAHFKGSHVLTAPVEVDPTSDATALRAYTGGATLTVGGELDKLASNISIGRDLAGVHWRTDGTEGMLLGERVAVALLKDRRKTYNEQPLAPLSFTGFKGDTITL